MSSPSNPSPEGKPQDREPIVVMLAVAVVLLLVLSVLVFRFATISQSSPQPKADGPTFYQALAITNGSVREVSGGPWTLYGVWGIASPLPFSPGSLRWPFNNLSANSCGAQFNGLTLWNGSIPLFDGSFDSGTAPFWQFAFFSNASQSILIATDVLGASHLYPPIGMASTCARATSLGATPWGWARAFSPFPADSSIMAASAWKAWGQHWMSTNQPAWEGYILGFGDWGSANPNGLIVKFARCGQVGAAGVQPVAYVIENSDGSWNNYFNGTQGCGNVASFGPPPVYDSYDLAFSPPIVSSGATTVTFNQSFQVEYGNKSGDVDSDAGGLVSWMTSLNLTTFGGQRLPSAAPGCASWVPSLTDCRANGSGWYAVLLSASGAWLGSYPSSPNGTAWEIPNVAIVSNQYLVVVAPSSWNVTGDVLSVNGTTPVAVVSGSVIL